MRSKAGSKAGSSSSCSRARRNSSSVTTLARMVMVSRRFASPVLQFEFSRSIATPTNGRVAGKASAAVEERHIIECEQCGKLFDKRLLDEVLFHQDHKHRAGHSTPSLPRS